jgi:Tfp pilus assembly protein PilV
VKITRSQLRKIIKESIREASDASKELEGLHAWATVGASGGALGALAAAAALGLSGVGGPVAFVVGLIGVTGLGMQTFKEVKKAEKKATAQRANDILRRTASMSLKKLKAKGLSDESVKETYRVIMKGSAEQVSDAIKQGLIEIDLNDLEEVQRDMKGSASSEHVDQKAIDEMVDELKDKLYS